MVRIKLFRNAKSQIESTFPRGAAIYRSIRDIVGRPSIEKVFSEIYRKNLWQNSESVSGRGSTLARTGAIMNYLPFILQDLNVKTLLDAPCGDFNWMRHTNLKGIKYIGADVVPDITARNREMYASDERTFLTLDITKDKIPYVDVILCRDCLIHLSFKDIHAALSNFKSSKSTYLLCTTHIKVEENQDAATGGWRSLNLQLPPFNFPEPLKLLTEDLELGKCLGIWRLNEL
jgi:hypothetical protein